jgi:hypothetical protein
MAIGKQLLALLAGGSAVGAGVAGAITSQEATAPQPVEAGDGDASLDIEGRAVRVDAQASPLDDLLDSANTAGSPDTPGTEDVITAGTESANTTNSPASANTNSPDTTNTASPDTESPDSADSPDNSGPGSESSGPGPNGDDGVDNSGPGSVSSGSGSGGDDNSGSGS